MNAAVAPFKCAPRGLINTIQMKTNQNNARDGNEEKTKNVFLNENQKPKLLHIYADRRRRKIGRLSRDSPQRRLSEDEKKNKIN